MPPDALQIGGAIAPATTHCLAIASGEPVD